MIFLLVTFPWFLVFIFIAFGLNMVESDLKRRRSYPHEKVDVRTEAN